MKGKMKFATSLLVALAMSTSAFALAACDNNNDNDNDGVKHTDAHELEWQKATDATCTAPETGKYVCKEEGCDYKGETQNKGTALGHNYGEWEIDEPTEEEEGLATKTCSRGNHPLEVTLPVLNEEDYSIEHTTPATDTEGEDTYTFAHTEGNIQFTVSTPAAYLAKYDIEYTWQMFMDFGSVEKSFTATEEGNYTLTIIDESQLAIVAADAWGMNSYAGLLSGMGDDEWVPSYTFYLDAEQSFDFHCISAMAEEEEFPICYTVIITAGEAGGEDPDPTSTELTLDVTEEYVEFSNTGSEFTITVEEDGTYYLAVDLYTWYTQGTLSVTVNDSADTIEMATTEDSYVKYVAIQLEAGENTIVIAYSAIYFDEAYGDITVSTEEPQEPLPTELTLNETVEEVEISYAGTQFTITVEEDGTYYLAVDLFQSYTYGTLYVYVNDAAEPLEMANTEENGYVKYVAIELEAGENSIVMMYSAYYDDEAYADVTVSTEEPQEPELPEEPEVSDAE